MLISQMASVLTTLYLSTTLENRLIIASKGWDILFSAWETDSFSTPCLTVQFLYTFPISVILKLLVSSSILPELFQEVNSKKLLQIRKQGINKFQ